MNAAVLHALGRPPQFGTIPRAQRGRGRGDRTCPCCIAETGGQAVGRRLTLCEPARSAADLRRGWSGTTGRRHARILRRAAAAVRRDGRAHGGAARAVLSGARRSGRPDRGGDSQPRRIRLAFIEAPRQAGSRRNGPDSGRHRCHRQAGRADRQNPGCGTRGGRRTKQTGDEHDSRTRRGRYDSARPTGARAHRSLPSRGRDKGFRCGDRLPVGPARRKPCSPRSHARNSRSPGRRRAWFRWARAPGQPSRFLPRCCAVRRSLSWGRPAFRRWTCSPRPFSR